MTQPVTQLDVARCLLAGIGRLINDQGVVAAAPLLGIDRSTAGRWRDKPDAELATVWALAATVLAEVRETGASATIAALVALLEGRADAARGEETDGFIMRSLADLAETLAEESRAVASGHVDLAEARELLGRFRQLQALSGRAVRILEDKLKRGLA